ncbi:MAG: hypothetical protein ABR574_13685 [Cryomorphaceae bacterium]|nr:hypothetical protein [Flavobacteriales bacterium]
MIERTLAEGSSPGWLPTREAGQNGSGTLCQLGILPGLRYGAKYLPFAKNGINWVESTGVDVISYNFTGCLMASFTYEGVRRVCHVSTGTGQDCKEEWERIKSLSTNVFEFRPSDFIDTKGASLNGCYGLITADLRTYSITVVRRSSGLEIASIKMARLLRV